MPEQTLSNIFRHVKTFFQPGYQYHGEVLVLLDGKVLPREIANGILNSVAKGRELPEKHSLRYVVWDMVQLPVIRGEQSCKKPYTERYADLKEFHQSGYVQLVKTKIVHSLPEAFEAYAEALKAGQEGIMLKSGDLMWKDHKTTKGCKLKLEVDVDLEITGFTEGKGKNANTFGAISMQTSDGLLKVDVSGMSDDMRLYIHLNRDKLLGTIATVKGNDVTKTTPASIFLPRLVELRADKVTADSYQMVVDAFESAKQCERSEVNAKMGVK
jgi:DNA ligase-1